MQQRAPGAADDADLPNLKLHVLLEEGGRFEAPAAAGYRVMELIRFSGFPIKAECGGAGVCSTCHVRISAAWHDRMPPPSDQELARLDEIPTADDASRLACQIVMTEELDGLEVEVQPDSLLRQTTWATV